MYTRKRVHGSGTLTITTAGTPERFPSIAAKSVVITAHEGNAVEGGTNKDVVIGGSDVVAASSGRKGVMLYPGQQEVFEVSNLDELYADATVSGAIVHYFWTR